MADPRSILLNLFHRAVEVAQPAACVPANLPEPPTGRTYVVGAGKASAAMARAVERNWSGAISGLVVTRYGFEADCDQIEIACASHPVPDRAGLAAARRIIEIAGQAGPDDLLLVLISGGGSALLTLPADGLTLADKQAVNGALLNSGAPIEAMNCIRKHLSKIKGGRLAAASGGAPVHTMVISDVVGDDLSTIASGPTVPDPTTYADARAHVERYDIKLPAASIKILEEEADETPKPGDPVFDRAETRIIAAPSASIEAAAALARAAGYDVISLGDRIEGEAREVGREHAQMALGAEAGTIILSGGELTVTLDKRGRGGPNAEYALALAEALGGERPVHALAADTDGIDGSEDNAGALVGPDTLVRAGRKGMNPARYLRDHNSYDFFAGLDDLVMTGPTRTNVNDFRAILVDG